MPRSITVVFFALWVLAGCQSQGDWVGTWRGKREVPTPPGGDPTVATTLATVELTIKPDATFSLTELGFGMDGSASLGAKTAELHVRTLLGRSISSLGSEAKGFDSPRKLRLVDADSLVFEADGQPALTLKRITAK